MDFSFAQALIDFYNSLDTYMVIFARLAGFFVISPVFAGRMVPMPSKVFMAFFMAMLIGMTGDFSDLPNYAGNVFAYAGILILEFMVGFLIGFIVYMVLSAMFLAGQLIDYQIGFMMVNVFDPITQVQVPITGNLYYLVMTAFFAATGVLHFFVFQMGMSYELIPIGSAWIFGNDSLMLYLVSTMTIYIRLGVAIAIPIAGVVLVLDVILGILVKAVPQMNMFVVGIPLKVIAGLTIMWITAPLLSDIFAILADQMQRFTLDTFELMSINP